MSLKILPVVDVCENSADSPQAEQIVLRVSVLWVSRQRNI